jgi:hypothetical protein
VALDLANGADTSHTPVSLNFCFSAQTSEQNDHV